MAELTSNNDIKPIAFYLPQYHSIPENDRAWGKGFTEWTNVKKAKKMFKDHNQPRIPLNNNYYNLLNDDVKIWQSNLAQKYGIYGFCYYHYWFKNGKKLLEKPAEQMLKNKSIDIPFCFSWANENWSRKWDGGDKEVIAEQDYGTEQDWVKHIKYLLPFFKDSRYITYESAPVFLIYKPELIPNLKGMMNVWNKIAQENGINRICFIVQNCGWYFSPFYEEELFDFQVEFEPFFSIIYGEKNIVRLERQKKFINELRKIKLDKFVEKVYFQLKKNKDTLHRGNALTVNDYDTVWKTINSIPFSEKLIKGAFCDWDNTPRSANGRIFKNVSVDKFQNYLHEELKEVKKQKFKVLFINAWNEWGEGTYLEPDTKNQYGYLNAIKNELMEIKNEK